MALSRGEPRSPERSRGSQHVRLRDLLRINLRSVRAYLLKEQFHRFWTYKSPTWAGRFLDEWTRLAMRSQIPPFQKFARTYEHAEIALYHALGNLPEPDWLTHKFF